MMKRIGRIAPERGALGDIGRAHILSEERDMRRIGFDQPHPAPFASTP